MTKVALIQASPAFFDLEGGLNKVSKWTGQAAEKGAQLVLFPEAYLPGYPRDFSFGAVVGSRTEAGRQTWQEYFDNALEISSVGMDRLCKVAEDNNVYLSVGIVEKERGTLYCTQVFITPKGELLGKHRKLKPTGSERIIWGEGDGSTLETYQTPMGIVGGLICWENYMPLARMAMYMKGVQIYLAPTADNRDTWLATLQHIAIEGRCFVLACNQFVTQGMYPDHLTDREGLEKGDQIISKGGSVIVSPFGEVMAGPLNDEEGMLMADLDMSEVTKGKLDFDVSGHYNRPDVFQFNVNGQPDTK
ncbi:MAG: carbon-nitrogen hydrolase family protein [Bacteroidota bacterium]